MRALLANWSDHIQLNRWRRWLPAFLVALFSGPIAAQTPGAFDPWFAAGDGKVTDLRILFGRNDAKAVALQPDGKIVLAGGCNNSGEPSEFCVARFLADGSLDPSFVGPGGSSGGRFAFSISSDTNDANAVAIQPDGKIVLAGGCLSGTRQRFCVARLLPNGSFDPGFGAPADGGRYVLPGAPTIRGVARALTIQPDGKIVLAGDCGDVDIEGDFCIARLQPDGTLDQTFVGPDATGGGFFRFPVGPGYDQANALALEPDGKIVLAGYCEYGAGASDDFCVARLHPNGSFDDSFNGPEGGSGRFRLPITANGDQPRSVTLQPDRRLIVAGSCNRRAVVGTSRLNYDFCLVRLNPNGSFDSTFGVAGLTQVDFPPFMTSFASAVSLQPDGNIVVAGTIDEFFFPTFLIARLTTHGFLDQSFDGPAGSGNGRFTLPMSPQNRDRANALAIQPDGKIVVVGTCGANSDTRFCIARVFGGPFHARQCTPDTDGDGLMTASIDALIETRVMLGLRGPSVIAGINFPANAKRFTWEAIRDYLAAQCGMSVF